MKASLPKDEDARIAALKSLGLLDSDPEVFFDQITRIAATILDVPIALVSLIDTDRQWFKSKVGIGASETPREFAFCAHAILTDEPFIVENAKEDARFSDNPLVTSQPNIRFYIGIPIQSLEGYQLGTLCAIDDKPRVLSQRQIEVLKDLALLVTQEIQHREQITNSLKLVQSSQSKFQAIFENAAIGIALVTPAGGWLKVNDDLCKIVGYSREELVKLTFQDITYPDDLDKDLTLLNQLVEGKINRYQMEKRYLRKDGTVVWIELSVTKQLDAKGDIEYFISIIKDIQAAKEAETLLLNLRKTLEDRVLQRTEELNQTNLSLSNALTRRLESEQNLKNRELELRMVIEHANDAYVCMNSDGLVTAWNRQAEKTFGWSETEALGKRLDKLIIPDSMQEAHLSGMKRYLESRQSNIMGKRIELDAIKKDGQIIPIELQINSLEINGQLIFSSFLRDITERKKIQKILEAEARNDLLTGLPNRRKFEELLPMALARANRNKHSTALFFIDLDGFKSINDTYGHDAGDSLLREVANRLDKSVRATDTVARLSGDEFVIIFDVIADGLKDVQSVAKNILLKLNEPMNIRGKSVTTSASIGIALYDGAKSKSISHEAFIKAADTAMYTAKHLGKNQYHISENKY
jgi:diguanylate cyclase (GGDEF)-like protein/PAS domain S-box-containing protein